MIIKWELIIVLKLSKQSGLRKGAFLVSFLYDSFELEQTYLHPRPTSKWDPIFLQNNCRTSKCRPWAETPTCQSRLAAPRSALAAHSASYYQTWSCWLRQEGTTAWIWGHHGWPCSHLHTEWPLRRAKNAGFRRSALWRTSDKSLNPSRTC